MNPYHTIGPWACHVFTRVKPPNLFQQLGWTAGQAARPRPLDSAN